jgi:hypothetical protein
MTPGGGTAHDAVGAPVSVTGLARAAGAAGAPIPGRPWVAARLERAATWTLARRRWLLAVDAAVIVDLPHGDFRVLQRGYGGVEMLRAGVPLPHIKEFLGHANIATTSIYATADNKMVRDAIQRAASSTPDPVALWKGDDDLILQLAGLH